MAVGFTKNHFDPRVATRHLFKKRSNLGVGRCVIGNAKLPLRINLVSNRIDRRSKKSRIGIVNRQEDRDEGMTRQTANATCNGQTITGIRLNEDMTSFQIREASGRLRSVWKTDLASYEIVRTSPMPSFKGKISGGDLDDLIAYLASLRAQPTSEVQAK